MVSIISLQSSRDSIMDHANRINLSSLIQKKTMAARSHLSVLRQQERECVPSFKTTSDTKFPASSVVKFNPSGKTVSVVF